MTQPNVFALRVEKPLMAKFRIIASEHNRSINREIVMLMKEAVLAYEEKNGPIVVPDEEEQE